VPRTKLVQVTEGQQKIKIVLTNQHSNLRVTGAEDFYFLLCLVNFHKTLASGWVAPGQWK